MEGVIRQRDGVFFFTHFLASVSLASFARTSHTWAAGPLRKLFFRQ